MAVCDLTGEKFERLTVIGFHGYTKTYQRLWDCQCDCGNKSVVSTSHLRSGHTRSCGCLHNEQLRERGTTHGGSHDRLFVVWCDMKRRCNKAYDKNYHNYGGRGVKVCKEWQDDYSVFKKWSLESGYDERMKYGDCTLDRIDQNGDYCPDNCRWVSLKVQNNNRRNNVLITYNGETKTATQWANIIGVSPHLLQSRKRFGWSDKEAIETPIGGKR